jgi:ribosomal protein S18 acetylase RimI-like enzyme
VAVSVVGQSVERRLTWARQTAAQSLLRTVYIAASRPTKQEIARGILIPHLFEDPKRRENVTFRELLGQAAGLSKEHFHEDALANVNNKSGQRFLLYCSGDLQELWGFAVYKFKMQSGILALGKLAVPEYLRGLGFGSAMVKELLRVGRAVPALDTMALSSLPGAIAFYKRLGFKKHEGALRMDDDTIGYIEGQVYMDYRFRKGKAFSSKVKKRR